MPSQEQIAEVLLQVAVYAGVPAANRAFAVAQQALRDVGAGELGKAGAAHSAVAYWPIGRALTEGLSGGADRFRKTTATGWSPASTWPP